MSQWLDEQYTWMSVVIVVAFVWILYRWVYPLPPVGRACDGRRARPSTRATAMRTTTRTTREHESARAAPSPPARRQGARKPPRAGAASRRRKNNEAARRVPRGLESERRTAE